MLCGTRVFVPCLPVLGRHLSSRPFKPVESPSPSKASEADFVPQCEDRQFVERISCSTNGQIRKAWVETLRFHDLHSPVGLIDLHPDVFSAFPRLDLIHKNLYWQAHYRLVDWRCITTRAELPYRSNQKPWPQKGTGRARHGNRRTHIWIGGAQCKGPRGPESYFSILPRDVRIAGLLSMLSVRHAQNDLHIVDNLRLSDEMEQEAVAVINQAIEANLDDSAEDDPLSAANRIRSLRFTKVMNESASYLRQLIDRRKWGPSVLFVTNNAITPGINQPITESLTQILDRQQSDGLAIYLACASYANHIEAELAPEAIAHSVDAVAPRSTHPGRGLTLMPLHGLNVWSLVHHNTVVFSRQCLEQLEQRLVNAMRMPHRDRGIEEPDLWSPTVLDRGEFEDDADEVEPTSRRHFSGRLNSLHWKTINLS